MKKLTEEQQEVWDRLKNGIKSQQPPGAHYMGTEAPVNPKAGSLYFDTNTCSMFFYDGKSWIEVDTGG